MEEVQKLKQTLDSKGIVYCPANDISVKDLIDRVPFEIPLEILELLRTIGTCTLREGVCLLGLDVDRPMDDICLRYLILTNSPLYDRQWLPVARTVEGWIAVDCTTGDVACITVTRQSVDYAQIDSNIIDYISSLVK